MKQNRNDKPDILSNDFIEKNLNELTETSNLQLKNCTYAIMKCMYGFF